MRSRAVSLPRSCCLAIFSSPPPSSAASRRSWSWSFSSVSGAVPGSRCCLSVASAAIRRAPPSASRSPPLRASASLPFRLAFLEEGHDALAQVVGGEGERELRAQELERVVERHVLLPIHRVVSELHQQRALRGAA